MTHFPLEVTFSTNLVFFSSQHLHCPQFSGQTTLKLGKGQFVPSIVAFWSRARRKCNWGRAPERARGEAWSQGHPSVLLHFIRQWDVIWATENHLAGNPYPRFKFARWNPANEFFFRQEKGLIIPRFCNDFRLHNFSSQLLRGWKWELGRWSLKIEDQSLKKFKEVWKFE